MCKRTGTEMKSFGTSSRIGYNSDKFYARKLYSDVAVTDSKEYIENSIPLQHIDRIFCQDSRKMDQLPDSSVHLMITSPPYNVGKDYDENLSLGEYRKLLRDVFNETYRVLVTGGRICINVANLGRKPYIPLHSYIIEDMLNIGYLMRGEIIWDKSASAGSSTAWGSFQSASNPTLRDVHEYILIFSKDSYSRCKVNKKDSISKEQFMQYTKSIWRFPAESAKRVKHPAPFPIELPSRLIQFYSFEKDIVLDPFCGSGSTCIAAKKLERHYIGYDTNSEYCQIARERLKNEFAQIEMSIGESKSHRYSVERRKKHR